MFVIAFFAGFVMGGWLMFMLFDWLYPITGKMTIHWQDDRKDISKFVYNENFKKFIYDREPSFKKLGHTYMMVEVEISNQD